MAEKILITGSNGQLAKEFQKVLTEKGVQFFAFPKEKMDIANFVSVSGTVGEVKPDVIINCAAYNSVDEAEKNPDRADEVNATALENLTAVCKKHNAFLVHYSSDYVFDGKKEGFYNEEDSPAPLNVYGKSKLKGEEIIKQNMADYLIFRISWVFGNGPGSFLYKAYQSAKTESILKVNAGQVSVPTYTGDIVNATLLSLEKKLKGLYHLASKGYASRYEWVKYFMMKMEMDNIILPVTYDSAADKAQRPAFSALSNDKISGALGIDLPYWENAVNKFVMECEW